MIQVLCAQTAAKAGASYRPPSHGSGALERAMSNTHCAIGPAATGLGTRSSAAGELVGTYVVVESSRLSQQGSPTSPSIACTSTGKASPTDLSRPGAVEAANSPLRTGPARTLCSGPSVVEAVLGLEKLDSPPPPDPTSFLGEPAIGFHDLRDLHARRISSSRVGAPFYPHLTRREQATKTNTHFSTSYRVPEAALEGDILSTSASSILHSLLPGLDLRFAA